MTTRELAKELAAQHGAGTAANARPDTAARVALGISTAIGASRLPALDLIVTAALRTGATGTCPVPGRSELLDPLNAALATGYAAHRSPAPPSAGPDIAAVLAAVLAVAPAATPTGPALLDAVTLGLRTQSWLTALLTPNHQAAGWDSVGTAGPIGAAVAASLMYGLSIDELQHAIAIASSMTLGHGNAAGTMVEAFHPGQAAANGVLATTLARRGFTGSTTALEGPRGYLRVFVAPPEATAPILGEAPAAAVSDADVDRQVATLMATTWPDRAPQVVAAVRGLVTADSCDHLLATIAEGPA